MDPERRDAIWMAVKVLAFILFAVAMVNHW